MLAFPFDECRDNRTIVRVQIWKLNIGKVFLCLFLLFLFRCFLFFFLDFLKFLHGCACASIKHIITDRL